MAYNKTAIRKLILEALSEEEFKIFCGDHFEKVDKEFSSGTSYQLKVFILVEHCKRYKLLSTLLEKLKERNAAKYAEYAEQVEVLDAWSKATPQPDDTSIIVQPTPQNTTHPLTQDLPAIKTWFLSILRPEEQVFVLTAALFSGLTRAELMGLYQEISRILISTEASKPETIPNKAAVTNSSGQTINLVVSLAEHRLEEEPSAKVREAGTLPKSPFVDEQQLFSVANLQWVEGKRATEAGATLVRLLKLEDGQRQKLLTLLGDHFVHPLYQLTPWLVQLGADRRAVIRGLTARIIGELMCQVDFNHYKEKVLLIWAMSDNFYMRSCVPPALNIVAQNERYRDNARALIKHWATSSSVALNWTGLACYSQLGTFWPEETLNLIKALLKQERLDMLLLATFVLQHLCQTEHALLVFKHLAEWLEDPALGHPTHALLALVFLDIADFEQIMAEGKLIDYTVNILLFGLKNDHRLKDAGLIQTLMLEMLKAWAETTLDDEEKAAEMANLLTRLYKRAATQREKDRIAWHLRQWQRKDKRFNQIMPPLIQ